MDDISVIAAQLDERQKKEIYAVFSSRNSMAARIITLMLEGKKLRPDIELLLRTTPATFYKACTEAKQELVQEASKFVETPFDEVYLMNSLILAGNFIQAARLGAQLEKQAETKQQWQQLELLYVVFSRLCQATGNIKMARQISTRRKNNAERLKTFIALSADLNTLLFEFEVYEKKNLPSQFVKKLEEILKLASRVGHYTLVHNSMQLQYLYYSRYTNDYAKASMWAEQMYRNWQQHKESLAPVTSVLALNVYFNFISIYSGVPGASLLSEIQKNIDIAGKHARMNFQYALMEYYLFSGSFRELETYLSHITTTDDNTKFSVLQHSVRALKYFAQKYYDKFRQELDRFYADTSRLDFPDAECYLRIAEATWLIDVSRVEEALYKLNSLRVFIDRNLNQRYDYERELVKFLSRFLKQSVRAGEAEKFLDNLYKAPYRSIRFFAEVLQNRLGEIKKGRN